MPYTSARIAVADPLECIGHLGRENKTDGLPVVHPAGSDAQAFMNASGPRPETVVADVTERAAVITTNMSASIVVMVGGRSAYTPVNVAGVDVMADPPLTFDHRAIAGSPWSVHLVAGRIDAHRRRYAFDHGNPARRRRCGDPRQRRPHRNDPS